MLWARTFVAASLVLAACDAIVEGDDAPADPPPAAPPSKTVNGKPAPPPFNADFGDAGPAPPGAPPPPGSCSDDNDPGGSEINAKVLPDTDDCDDTMKEISGVAKNAVDADFYKLTGNDLGVSLAHPFGCSLDTDFEVDTPNVELCVFARCKNAQADAVTGCKAGGPVQSDTGLSGCCASTPGGATPEWNCAGLADDDSADFFLRVRQVNSNTCLPYKIRYRF